MGSAQPRHFSTKAALSFQVLANVVVLRKPEGQKAVLGEALWVGSRNLQVQRRSRPLTWTYDPWLRPQPACRVPQDGLFPQAQTALHELPGAQRPAPLPGSPPGSAAELQLGLEQVQEARAGRGAPPAPEQGQGLAELQHLLRSQLQKVVSIEVIDEESAFPYSNCIR